MADAYLTISYVANDGFMVERVRACATQQEHLGSIGVDDPYAWAYDNRYLWASSPGWAEKWDYALQTHEDPGYAPGSDPAVITDADILASVQALASTK